MSDGFGATTTPTCRGCGKQYDFYHFDGRCMACVKEALRDVEILRDARDILSGISSFIGCGIGEETTTPEQYKTRIEDEIARKETEWLRYRAALERITVEPGPFGMEFVRKIAREALNHPETPDSSPAVGTESRSAP